jgi:hypothetical protein
MPGLPPDLTELLAVHPQQQRDDDPGYQDRGAPDAGRPVENGPDGLAGETRGTCWKQLALEGLRQVFLVRPAK